MVQVIRDPGRAASFGASVGRGLGGALEQLAARKMQQVQLRQQRSEKFNTFQNLGYSPQDASVLASWSEPTQMAYIKEFPPPGIEQAMAQLGQQQKAPQVPGVQALAGLGQQPMQQEPMQAQQVEPVVEQPVPVQVQQPTVPEKPERRMTASQRAKQVQMDRRQVAADKKMAAADKKADRLHQFKIDKETKAVYKDINDKAVAAYEGDRRINRMEVLVNKGDLSRPRWHALLATLSKGVMGHGINLHSLETADSQEFLKLSQEFLKDAKKIFGARVTNMEIENLLKMIPSLSQSKEGKLRIINNMKLYNEGAQVKKAAMDDIIQENDGHRPLNLESMVEKRSKAKLDELSRLVAKGSMPGTELKKAPSFLESITPTLPEPVNPLDIIFGKG